MTTLRNILVVGLCVLTFLTVGPVPHVVPPHQPGTICLTPQFWCWIGNPVVGLVNASCTCPSPYGPVAGFTG
jgi:hypothetical protein